MEQNPTATRNPGSLDALVRPKVYRNQQGQVFGPWGELSLHKGFWWADVGCPVMPEGAEKNVPLWPNYLIIWKDFHDIGY
jgi:hypothetical protein